MDRDCAVNFDHIQTVSKSKIGSLVSVLSPEKLEEVQEAILFSLNLC
jgi:mRNA interferase MazF